MADKIKSQPGNEGQNYFGRGRDIDAIVDGAQTGEKPKMKKGTKKHMSKKASQKRGPSHIERSKSGGAVKGKIPLPGGSNKTNHETGVSTIKYGKGK